MYGPSLPVDEGGVAEGWEEQIKCNNERLDSCQCDLIAARRSVNVGYKKIYKKARGKSCTLQSFFHFFPILDSQVCVCTCVCVKVSSR